MQNILKKIGEVLTEHRYLLAELSLFWAMLFIVLWSNVFPLNMIHPNIYGVDPLWLISLLCNVLSLVVFCLFLTRLPSLNYVFFAFLSCGCTSAGIIVLALNDLITLVFWEQLYFLGAVLVGIGTGFLMACLAYLLCRVPPKTTFICMAAAFFLSSIIYLILTSMIVQQARWIFVIALIAFMAFFYAKDAKQPDASYTASDPDPSSLVKRKSRFATLACLVAAIGLTAGVMRGLNQSSQLPFAEDHLFIVTVMFTSIVLLGISTFIDSFRPTLLLQIAMIVIAGAFVVLAAFARGSTIAFVLHTVGFLCFVALVWFFCSYYSWQNKYGPKEFAFGLLANQAGQAAGTLIFAIATALFGNSSSSTLYISLGIVYLLFIIALIFFANSSRSRQIETIPTTGDDLLVALNTLSQKFGLTPREEEVALHIAHGKSRQDIASSLHVSQETVKTHTKHLYQKTGIHSPKELLARIYEELPNDFLLR